MRCMLALSDDHLVNFCDCLSFRIREHKVEVRIHFLGNSFKEKFQPWEGSNSLERKTRHKKRTDTLIAEVLDYLVEVLKRVNK